MGFVDAVGDAIKSGVCTSLRAGDTANRFFNELSPIDLPNFSRYWVPKLCDDDPADVPQPEPPFDGGQCSVEYDVRPTRAGGSPFQVTRSGFGPFSNLRTSLTQTGGGCDYEVRIADVNGTDLVWTGTFTGSLDDCDDSAPLGVTLARADGQPDNCGSPPVDIPPYQPTTININPTYIDNSGDTVNLNGSFTLYAPVFVGGNVIAPVTVNLGDIEFNGNLELAPDFEFNFGSPPSDEAPGFGDDLPPNDDPSDSPDTPEDDDTREIIGIVVTSTPNTNPSTTFIAQGDAPSLYVPRIGSAYFRVRTASGLAWFGPIDIKQRRQFIPAPPDVRTLTARTAFESGWSGNTTLIYRDSRPDS